MKLVATAVVVTAAVLIHLLVNVAIASYVAIVVVTAGIN